MTPEDHIYALLDAAKQARWLPRMKALIAARDAEIRKKEQTRCAEIALSCESHSTYMAILAPIMDSL